MAKSFITDPTFFNLLIRRSLPSERITFQRDFAPASAQQKNHTTKISVGRKSQAGKTPVLSMFCQKKAHEKKQIHSKQVFSRLGILKKKISWASFFSWAETFFSWAGTFFWEAQENSWAFFEKSEILAHESQNRF